MKDAGLLESEIQVQVVGYLSLMAPLWGFLFFSVPNEGLGSARSGAGVGRMVKLRRMGLRSGVSDIVIVKGGRAYFLELKRRLGKQSVNQLAFEADAIRVGAEYAVAHGFDEAVEILRQWKIAGG